MFIPVRLSYSAMSQNRHLNLNMPRADGGMFCGKSKQVILCDYVTYSNKNFGLNQELYKEIKIYPFLFHLRTSKRVSHSVVSAIGVGNTDFSFLYLLANTLY